MRIAVVGTCASGKSTIVSLLRERGYDAYVVGQEHSIIRDLWRHQSPDALVYLHADFETIKSRRGNDWPRWIFDLQTERLRHARAHAALVVDTTARSTDETARLIVTTIENLAGDHEPGSGLSL